MGMHKVVLDVSVTDSTGEEVTGGQVRYGKMGDDGLAAVMQHSAQVVSEAQKHQGKGGTMTATFTATVDGAPGPNGGKISITGVDWDAVNEVEDKLADVGKDLVKLGRNRAKVKGAHKP